MTTGHALLNFCNNSLKNPDGELPSIDLAHRCILPDTSQQLFQEFVDGSNDAAEAIFNRYLQRLTSLARMRLSERIARKIDPDDIVLSAYRSFFIGARQGRFEVGRGGDLWRLLVSITMHKLHHQVAAFHAQKRHVSKEDSNQDPTFVPSRDPTPDEVVAATDELEAILSALPPLTQRIVELRMQGETLQEIATDVGRTERTVRRLLETAKDLFRQRLDR